MKEAVEDGGRTSHEDSVPALKQMKTFRRKKTKPLEQPKIELDLANALPASDDFRTSLLMTGLSARFSMLREQDDPNSKLGKASDDSVLFPRRQSRMNNFDFTPKGLSDIAEVGSISDSKRPFASIEHERNGSSYSIDDVGGSIMNRAKPAEGNNLFGGRQKVYKIPNSSYSSSALGNSDATGQPKAVSGRAVYEDDLTVSPFQRLKQKEREVEQKEKERQEQLLASGPAEDADTRSDSPPLPGYNRNRETTSTTSSGQNETRSSTAATSFISQRTPSVNGYSAPSTPAVPSQTASNGVERSLTKTKRLYENGLDHHMHTQQSSAANRLDNLSRQGRSFGVRSPSPSPASPEAPKFPVQSPKSFQPKAAATPDAPQPVTDGFEFGIKSSTKGPKSPSIASPIASPIVKPVTSPTITEEDDTDTLLIQSNALPDTDGPVVKPTQQYNEAEYHERQLQMQGERNIQTRKPSPPRMGPVDISSNVPTQRHRAETHSAFNSNANANRSRSASAAHRDFAPRDRIYAPNSVLSHNMPPTVPPVDLPRPNMLRKNDYRPDAGTSEGMKPRIPVWEQSAQGQFARPMQRFDENNLKDRQRIMQPTRDGQPPRRNPPPNHFPPAMNGNGMAPRSRADSHSAFNANLNGNRSRSNSTAQREFLPRERVSPVQNTPPLSAQPTVPLLEKPRSRPITPKDSPTPAAVAESPKQKMSAWEQASAYDEFEADIPASLKTSRWTPPEHPALRDKKPERHQAAPVQPPPIQALKAPTPIETTIKEEVEPAADSPTLPARSALRGLVRQHLRSDSDASTDEEASVKASAAKSNVNPWDGNDWDDGNIDAVQPSPLKIGNQMRSNGPPPQKYQASQVSSRAVSTVSDTPSWEKELTRQHTREQSTESQKERTDFANELAARRKRVQENLRSFAESESRSQSPVRHPALDDSTEATFAKTNRLNFLKAKTSRGSLVAKDEAATSGGPINSKGMKMLGINGSYNSSSATVNSHRVEDNMWKQEEEDMMRGLPRKSPVPPASEFRQTRRDAQRERERHMLARHQQQLAGPEYSSHPDDRSRRRQMDQPLPLRQADYGRSRNQGTRTRSPSREAPPVTYRGYQTPGGMF